MRQLELSPTVERYVSLRSLSALSCLLYLCFAVSSTIFTEASKSHDGTYPYETFTVPIAVEALKFLFSAACLSSEVLRRRASISLPCSRSLREPLKYAVPAACYFVSNNCMFYIIRELGASTFQITNNLKFLSTGGLMYVFLDRKLTRSSATSKYIGPEPGAMYCTGRDPSLGVL